MAVRVFRNLTFILFLTLSVAALSVSMHAPASAGGESLRDGGGYGTSGDPDQPKDTSPRPTHSTTTSNSSALPIAELSDRAKESHSRRMVGKFGWMSEVLIRRLMGRPGLFL